MNPFNLEATVDAIRLLNEARVRVAGGSTAVWRILMHAAEHLDKEVTAYLRG